MPTHHYSSLRVLLAVLVVALVANILYTLHLNRVLNRLSRPNPGEPTDVALVVGSDAPYWEQCIAGAQQAAGEYGVNLHVYIPTNGLAGQNQILRALLADRVDSIAISPVDHIAQASLLNLVGGSSNLITIDSDAPYSRRKFYLGTNNYKAGRQCGELVKEALPGGGRIVIAVGSLDKVNGQQRRRGLIDELLDRSPDADREEDPVDTPIGGGTYTILETVSDHTDRSRARDLAAATLRKYPDLDGMVGLYAYNIPEVLGALAEMPDRTPPVLISFDDRPETLDAIEQGTVHATLVQAPYTFGFEAVRLLAAMAAGPASGPIADSSYFSCKVVKQDNLADYRREQRAGMARP